MLMSATWLVAGVELLKMQLEGYHEQRPPTDPWYFDSRRLERDLLVGFYALAMSQQHCAAHHGLACDPAFQGALQHYSVLHSDIVCSTGDALRFLGILQSQLITLHVCVLLQKSNVDSGKAWSAGSYHQWCWGRRVRDPQSRREQAWSGR